MPPFVARSYRHFPTGLAAILLVGTPVVVVLSTLSLLRVTGEAVLAVPTGVTQAQRPVRQAARCHHGRWSPRIPCIR